MAAAAQVFHQPYFMANNLLNSKFQLNIILFSFMVIICSAPISELLKCL